MTLDGISLKELFQYIIVIQQNVCVAVICIWIILLANYLPPFYCWETSMPTVPYGVALKLISEER